MWSVLLNSNLQWVLFSTMILGIAAGTIGCLSYWKKQSLMSDALAHAALPGVVIAYMMFEEKNLFILICGATISALLGAFFIQSIQSQTMNFRRYSNGNDFIRVLWFRDYDANSGQSFCRRKSKRVG